MLHLFLRAQRAWSSAPASVKVAAVVFALLALGLANTTTVLAGSEGEPFRWK